MKREKNTSEITTKVTQRVATKTKVLVGMVMGLAIVGMLGFASMAFENVKKFTIEGDIQVQSEEKGYFVNQDMDPYSSFDSSGQYMTNGSFNDREEKELNIEEIQKALEKKGTLWQGIENRIFKLNKEKRGNLLGLQIIEEELREAKQRERNQVGSRDGELPDFFDWRDLHGGLDYTTPVRDQGSCGSCWAFGALGALEAGIEAYYNNPNLNIDLSEQDLVSCYLGDGCFGAYASEVESLFNNYFQDIGVANESCFPYTATNNDCENKCSDWQNEAWITTSYENVELTVDAIKTALIENGPLEVGMEVYADFLSYNNGIYHHVTGGLLGYHAVLIVGFGVYDGMDYWIVKNSWGEDWGDNGYFKILTGDSMIDSWFAYGINIPEQLIGDSPERLCVDQDEDGYCYWGLGDMPSTCSSTCILDISDCNDANGGMFEDCGQNTEVIGFLNIISEPSDAEVYIKDLDSNNWIHRGNTPLEFKLNVGEREIKIRKFGYFESITIIDVEEGMTDELFIELEHDSQFQEGWPVQITTAYPNESRYGGAFSVSDLNNDGAKETVVITTTHDINTPYYADSVYVINSNGEFMPGWPKTLPEDGYVRESATLADLDGDGDKEIIILARYGFNSPNWPNSYIQIYNHDGTDFPGWPRLINPSNQVVRVSVADINLDGNLDIIAGSGSSYGTVISCDFNEDCEPAGVCNYGYCMDIYREVYAFNYDGTNLTGWPIEFEIPYIPRSSPVLTNLDDDPELEVIITAFHSIDNPNTQTHYVYAFNHDSTIVDGFPYSLDNYWGWTIISGDVNNDGLNEIVTQKGPITNNGESMYWENTSTKMYSVSMANVNNNYNLEILYGDADGKAYLVDHEGNNLTGWPIDQPEDNIYADGTPIVADLFGDNQKEIIISWWSYTGEKPGLYVYNLDGTLVEGFPKFEGLVSIYSSIVNDIDNDGDLELIAVSSNGQDILVLDLDKEYDPLTIEWSQFQHDAQYTGNYNFERCSNEIAYDQCFSEKPLFCSNGELRDNCQECGCPINESCQEDGSCSLTTVPKVETTSHIK